MSPQTSSLDVPQASGEKQPISEGMRFFTRNRSAAVEESARESVDYPGYIAARSLDGTRTFAYGKSIEDVRNLLLAAGMSMSDVVLEAIDDHLQASGA